METLSALLAICAGNSPVPGEFPTQRPVTRIFDVFFDLRLNKRLSKQPWGWRFETLSRPLWCYRNATNSCKHMDTYSAMWPLYAYTWPELPMPEYRCVSELLRKWPVSSTEVTNCWQWWPRNEKGLHSRQKVGNQSTVGPQTNEVTV